MIFSVALNKAKVLQYTAIFFAYYCVFQLLFSIGHHFQLQRNIDMQVTNISTRVALDLPYLHIANPLTQISGNSQRLANYINGLNEQLAAQNANVFVSAIVNNSDYFNLYKTDENAKTIVVPLAAPQQTLWLIATVNDVSILGRVSYLAIFVALLLLDLTKVHIQGWRVYNDVKASKEPVVTVWMTIDLAQRQIINNVTGQNVNMSNKPFCFYAALLEFSGKYPDNALNPNKDLPQELIELSNKYFYRLIELGHTIRKRPDFNSNLDKVLSEIRAGLDELFADMPEIKTMFYPPKAIGEGARSKSHSFTLANLDVGTYEIIGK
ncbi:hypothetical protein [Flocculibacter collagenilyticus]|uniref:hypothetical protein n=1 Tax=Flocculibacter collagenilyticus TaxID=2744479 RepID=UPI0018F5E7CE|nr:hypothetical protein [Flocculibacter collagenilyticus]